MTQETKHTVTPWYVGIKNDCNFIINKIPRPSNDDVVDIPEVEVIAKIGSSRTDDANAVLICEAVNSHAALKTKNERLRDALTEARAFMDSCQVNDTDDLFDKSDDRGMLDDLKTRIDTALAGGDSHD
jgi:hypothetical protein